MFGQAIVTQRLLLKLQTEFMLDETVKQVQWFYHTNVTERSSNQM